MPHAKTSTESALKSEAVVAPEQAGVSDHIHEHQHDRDEHHDHDDEHGHEHGHIEL